MVTMRDIAKKAGVSQATVSYAFTDDSNISPDTRRKVLRIARELNYTVNLSARMLRSGRNKSIGLILQDLSNPYSIHLADAISTQALDRGLQTIIQQTMYRHDMEQQALQHIAGSLCDGMIFCPTKFTWPEIRALLGTKPLVLVSPEDETIDVDTIGTSVGSSAFTATSYLISHGCREPLFMGNEFVPYEQIAESRDSTLSRVAGFERALIANGIPVTPDRFHNPRGWNARQGRDSVHDLVKLGIAFDGLVCINDYTAIGALRGLNDLGIRIPEEVQVIGLDGVSNGAYTYPALSTVAIDFEDFAEKAITMLCDRIADLDSPARHLTTATRLIIRESTR